MYNPITLHLKYNSNTTVWINYTSVKGKSATPTITCTWSSTKVDSDQEQQIRTFQVAQRVSICLPMRGTQLRSLVWEDSTSSEQLGSCPKTTEPACCNYWSLSALEVVLCNKRSHGSLQLEKACVRQRRPKKAKNEQTSKFIFRFYWIPKRCMKHFFLKRFFPPKENTCILVNIYTNLNQIKMIFT